MIIDADKLQNACDTIREFNAIPIENLLDSTVLRDEVASPVSYTTEDVKEWKFIGLSNIAFLKNYGIIK